MSSAVIEAIRDAASSTANGIPSRRWQISFDHVPLDRPRSPARHCGHARRTSRRPYRRPASAPATAAHRRPRVLHGWWPSIRHCRGLPRGWLRSDLLPHRGCARSCRIPAAGLGPPARRPPTPSPLLPGCWVMPSTAATASGTAAGSVTAASSKSHTRRGIRRPAARRLQSPDASCRLRRRRSA